MCAIAKAQRLVKEFHEKFHLTIGDTPAIREPMLRIALISEEADEFTDALQARNLAGAVDALCDLLYVTLGAAVAFGVDLEPHLLAVHATNMAKEGGVMRLDGKLLKPAGWEPPDIHGILEAQGWDGK